LLSRSSFLTSDRNQLSLNSKPPQPQAIIGVLRARSPEKLTGCDRPAAICGFIKSFNLLRLFLLFFFIEV
jgi:hypothetical protein